MRDGTVKHSDKITWEGDDFKEIYGSKPGYYVYFGMWKGPFDSEGNAKSAYREWAWELKHS